jgi:hypothetical protein
MITKNNFKNYNVDEPVDQIFIVKNFLYLNEINELLDFINNVDEQLWHEEYLRNLKPFCMQKFGRDDVENLVKEGLFEITQNWHDKIIMIENRKETDHIFKKIHERLNLLFDDTSIIRPSGNNTIQRMQPGVELKSHTDQDTDPSITHASIIYLNDDYLDGELYFVNKNYQIKPEPGTLIIFPGTKEYEHGVKTVGKGPIRYVLPGFIHYKNFYNDKKN